MRQVVTAVLAFVLLLSGSLSPRLEAAFASTTCASKSVARTCCCGRAPGEGCCCEVAPSAPRPAPLESASVASSVVRPAAALATSRVVLAALARPSLRLLDRFGRRGHLASVGPRLHLLVGVFRE